MPRPRGQRGQIKHHGSNWIFVYYAGDKRTHAVLAPFALCPFRDSEQVREKFADKINALLRPVNASVPSAAMMDGLLTVEKYINEAYWKRCEQRQQLEGANHMEPSTIHGYRKVFSRHIMGKPVASIQIGRFTTKDGQDWLDSIPQNLSHKTHLRVRAFLSGVLTAALQSNVISGVNPMDATKAGAKSKGRKESELTPRELKIR